ncbi:MAG: LysR substrate-binding domain-containing protein [Ruegeria sp.]
MRDIWKLLHSPRNLIIFEAAARSKSFTRAAEELSIQQPSVSAAIKQLESALGVHLFVRRHRSVTLTEAGQRLFATASRALNDIEHCAAEIRHTPKDRHVTLNSSTAFSYYWMMPRVHDLRQKHPDIDLRMQISDREPDLDEENISLAIRLGDGNWPGYDAALIANEVIYPVASPQVMHSARNLRSVPNLLHERLIHLEEPIRARPSWRQWFEHHGITNSEVSAGLKLNDYALVLQAAMNGEGFSFGWHHVVRSLIAKGQLAARQEWAWRTGKGFYLVWSKTRVLSEDAVSVREWVLDQARTDRETDDFV